MPGLRRGSGRPRSAAHGIVQGYQLSIVFMMAMPFLIVGSFGGYVYYSVRKRQEQSPPEDAPPSEAQ
ncbi:MAG: hypothetical protein QM775_12130 [Pirellulales bacterium]